MADARYGDCRLHTGHCLANFNKTGGAGDQVMPVLGHVGKCFPTRNRQLKISRSGVGRKCFSAILSHLESI